MLRWKNSLPDKDRIKLVHFGSSIMNLCKLILVVLQIGLFAAGWMAMSTYTLYAQTTLMLSLVYAILIICMHRVYNGLDVGNSRVLDMCIGQGLSLIVVDVVMVLVLSLTIKRLPNLGVMLLVLLIQLAVTVLWCLAVNQLYYLIFPPSKAIVVYEDGQSRDSIEGIYHLNRKFNVIRTLDAKLYPGDELARLQEELLSAESVFLCGISAQRRNDLLKYCIDKNINVYVRPKIGDVLISTAKSRYLCHVPVLVCDSTGRLSAMYLFAKRAMDLVVSGLMMIVFGPVMLAVAIAVKHEDHGPALFRQKRLTKDGKVFEVLKFRSMRVDAEKDGVARLAASNDDRITRVGRFIRATRLDELPQLINIFRGDMTLVGPRPERPEIAEQYTEILPEFHMRLKVKAGLTGYAQVHGKYNTTPYDKLQMDLMYIADMSLALDLKLIFLTVRTMFSKESTEGVEKEQMTAMRGREKSA